MNPRDGSTTSRPVARIVACPIRRYDSSEESHDDGDGRATISVAWLGNRLLADVCGGDARIAGTRIAVPTLEQYRRLSMTEAQVLAAYPGLRASIWSTSEPTSLRIPARSTGRFARTRKRSRRPGSTPTRISRCRRCGIKDECRPWTDLSGEEGGYGHLSGVPDS